MNRVWIVGFVIFSGACFVAIPADAGTKKIPAGSSFAQAGAPHRSRAERQNPAAVPLAPQMNPVSAGKMASTAFESLAVAGSEHPNVVTDPTPELPNVIHAKGLAGKIFHENKVPTGNAFAPEKGEKSGYKFEMNEKEGYDDQGNYWKIVDPDEIREDHTPMWYLEADPPDNSTGRSPREESDEPGPGPLE
jgi:hypothetical protein